MGSSMYDYDQIVSSIYDCAANPEGWATTLTQIRDRLGAAYVMVGYADMAPIRYNQTPIFTYRNTAWDADRLRHLQGLTQDVPGAEHFLNGVIDNSWTQMEHISREEFEETKFCREWAGPQGLTDCCIVPYIARPHLIGMFNCTLHKSRGDEFNDEQRRLAELFAPHVRRAIMINDIVDKGNLATAIYRKVLDQLSVAVFIVGAGQRVVFTNAAGDALLSENNLLGTISGALMAHGAGTTGIGLEGAIERAQKGDAMAGITGIGVPLLGKDGARAAAYVLPIAGKDIRGELGRGHCAVFVSRRREQQPMAMEILRTMFDFTVAEARVALALAKGDGPQEIADALGVSVHTVRSHLKHAYGKAGVADQTGLVAVIAAIMLPLKDM